MNRSLAQRLSIVSLALLAGFCAGQAAAADFMFPALREGALVMRVPDRWQADEEVATDPSGDAHTARFIDSVDGNFVVLVTVIQAPPAPAAPALTPTHIQTSVARFADDARRRSVETELPVVEFSSGDLVGAYFSATDRAPDIDEFKFLTQGLAAVGSIPVTFTALSNRNPELARDELLTAISSLQLESGGK